jgi:hypothetical protein
VTASEVVYMRFLEPDAHQAEARHDLPTIDVMGS